MKKIKGLSLFANVGVAEAYLADIGVDILVANEINPERARFYKHIYPKTEMIVGDITKEKIFNNIVSKSKEVNVDLIMATPPCQGMSTVGKKNPNDSRNKLIYYAIKAINILTPKYVLLENVPQQLKTKIKYAGKEILIPEYINKTLGERYNIRMAIVNATDYGVPQIRQRSVFLLVRKDLKIKWDFIMPKERLSPITLKQAIGSLPSLDPKIQGASREEQLKYFPEFEKKITAALKISKWHIPPLHKIRHIETMRYTPEGMSALKNTIHYPVNKCGSKIKGYPNTYKRQWWDRPAYTVTTYNGAICSHDNVHPGRPIGKKDNEQIFSDPRVFSIYELLIVMSLPKNWNIPEWASESLIRHSIGEGIPPLIIKKLMLNLLNGIKHAK